MQISIGISVKGSRTSGSAPVNTVSPVISGTTTIGSVLTSTFGDWLNSPTSYSFQWNRNGSPIPSATGFNYTLVQADSASAITCVVTATNASGSTPATSNIITAQTSDTDAQAFITATGITNTTQKNAINDLVIGLKTDSLWTKMLAVYPFVGGTQETCKFNLKNPLNTDAAFRLSFQGGWTFSSNGIQPNGTNTYADTFLVPSTSLTLGSVNGSSFSVYSKTNNLESGSLFGTRNLAFGSNLNLTLRNGSNSVIWHNTNAGIVVSPNPLSSSINLITSRIDTLNNITAQNGATNTQASPEVELSAFSLYLSAQNQFGTPVTFSTRQLAFAHIGTGLTQAQCTQLYNRIQTFQTTLDRANI